MLTSSPDLLMDLMKPNYSLRGSPAFERGCTRASAGRRNEASAPTRADKQAPRSTSATQRRPTTKYFEDGDDEGRKHSQRGPAGGQKDRSLEMGGARGTGAPPRKILWSPRSRRGEPSEDDEEPAHGKRVDVLSTLTSRYINTVSRQSGRNSQAHSRGQRGAISWSGFKSSGPEGSEAAVEGWPSSYFSSRIESEVSGRRNLFGDKTPSHARAGASPGQLPTPAPSPLMLDIKKADSLRALQDILNSKAARKMDSEQFSLVILRVAGLCVGGSTPLEEGVAFTRQLEPQLLRFLQSGETKVVLDISYGLAQLGAIDPEVAAVILSSSMDKLYSMSGSEVAKLTWSLASLQQVPSSDWLLLWHDSTRRKMQDMRAGELAWCCWAAAVWQCSLSREWWLEVYDGVIRQGRRLKPWEVASVLWGMARLRDSLPKRREIGDLEFDEPDRSTAMKSGPASDVEIPDVVLLSNVYNMVPQRKTLKELGVPVIPSSRRFAIMDAEEETKLEEQASEDDGTLDPRTSALVRSRQDQHKYRLVLGTLVEVLYGQLRQCSSYDLCTCVTALVMLGVRKGEFPGGFIHRVEELTGQALQNRELSPEDLADILYALGCLRWQANNNWYLTFFDVSTSMLDELSGHALSRVLHSVAQYSIKPRKPALLQLVQEAEKKMEDMSPQDLSDFLWSVGHLHGSYEVTLQQPLEPILAKTVELCNGDQLGDIVWGLSKLNIKLPTELLESFKQTCKSSFSDLQITCQGINRLLLGLHKMRVPWDEALMTECYRCMAMLAMMGKEPVVDCNALVVTMAKIGCKSQEITTSRKQQQKNEGRQGGPASVPISIPAKIVPRGVVERLLMAGRSNPLGNLSSPQMFSLTEALQSLEHRPQEEWWSIYRNYTQKMMTDMDKLMYKQHVLEVGEFTVRFQSIPSERWKSRFLHVVRTKMKLMTLKELMSFMRVVDGMECEPKDVFYDALEAHSRALITGSGRKDLATTPWVLQDYLDLIHICSKRWWMSEFVLVKKKLVARDRYHRLSQNYLDFLLDQVVKLKDKWSATAVAQLLEDVARLKMACNEQHLSQFTKYLEEHLKSMEVARAGPLLLAVGSLGFTGGGLWSATLSSVINSSAFSEFTPEQQEELRQLSVKWSQEGKAGNTTAELASAGAKN